MPTERHIIPFTAETIAILKQARDANHSQIVVLARGGNFTDIALETYPTEKAMYDDLKQRDHHTDPVRRGNIVVAVLNAADTDEAIRGELEKITFHPATRHSSLAEAI